MRGKNGERKWEVIRYSIVNAAKSTLGVESRK